MNQDLKEHVYNCLTTLRDCPARIDSAMKRVNELKARLPELKESVVLAENNAEVDAWVAINEFDGKMLADEKKSRIKAHIAQDAAIRGANYALEKLNAELAEAQREYDTQRNVFNAARAAAELFSAMLGYHPGGGF